MEITPREIAASEGSGAVWKEEKNPPGVGGGRRERSDREIRGTGSGGGETGRGRGREGGGLR